MGKMNKRVLLGFLMLLLGLSACKQDRLKSPDSHSLSSSRSLLNPAYTVNSDSIREYIRARVLTSKDMTPLDSVITAHYWNQGAFFWLGEELSLRADSMLYWLDNASRHGLESESFAASTIRDHLYSVRSLQLKPGENINRLLADLEYQLTVSYLSYVSGLSYGFLSPAGILNNLEEDDSKTNTKIVAATDQKKKMKELYAIRLKRCDKRAALNMLVALQQNPFAALRRAQPTSTYYLKLQEELERLHTLGNTDSLTLDKSRVRVNLERARWQYAQDKGEKYVFVNVAAFMLRAINEETDSILEMRICCGSPKNKTPLLSSRIYYMELNPYWNVPQNIILREVIPAYRRDTTYFTKNRMKVYDMDGNQLNPHSIKWSKYTTGVPFMVKQDNKEGNSLGRIIFRFPNTFDVYLHDTPSRWAFTKDNRAVSHGCVRLEKALDFAFFLLSEPDELLEDRIRVAMDIAPQSEAGKNMRRSEAYRELKHYSLKSYIPVYLDYQTIYLNTDGTLGICDDVYHYDAPLLAALMKLNYK